MGNDARIFCIRVSGLQTNPLSEEVLAELKDWSTITERFPNGDILYSSPHMLGNPGNLLLKFLHDNRVRFNYFARNTTSVDDLKMGMTEPEVPTKEPETATRPPRPMFYQLHMPNLQFDKLSKELKDELRNAAISTGGRSHGRILFNYAPWDVMLVLAKFMQLIAENVQVAVEFVPEGGGK